MSVVWEGITPGFYHQYSYEIAEYYVYWIYKSIDDAPDELKDYFTYYVIKFMSLLWVLAV